MSNRFVGEDGRGEHGTAERSTRGRHVLRSQRVLCGVPLRWFGRLLEVVLGWFGMFLFCLGMFGEIMFGSGDGFGDVFWGWGEEVNGSFL